MVWLDKIKEAVGFKKGEQPRFFWVACLDSQKVSLALIEFRGGEGEILEVRTKTIKRTEDLLGLTEVIKDLAETVPGSEKPQRIFWGVPDFWFQNGELKEPHKKALKKLSQDLELTFLGTISIFKAILEFYRHQEGTPASLIFLEILPQKIRVALCRQGQVETRSEKEKGESVASTLQEVLRKEFTGESLPARIVVLGADDFGEVKNEISASSFEETGLFLHLPKVESLSSKELLTAIGLLVKESLKIRPEERATPLKETPLVVEKETLSEEERFGFVLDEDVSRKQGEIKAPSEEKVFLPQPVTQKEIGFSVSPILHQVSERIRKLPLVFSRLDLSRLPKSGLLVGGPILLLLIGIFLGFWYLPKAKIILFVEPEELKETLELMIVPEGIEASESAKVIRGKLVTADFSGELSVPATGTELTGEKATGRVTVFNKTVEAKSFPQGTELVGPNDLVFTLDQAVSVDPSTVATASGSETKVYGRAEVGVTADDIGSEYNLPSGIDFSLDNFSPSLYSAYSAEGFSGGSSQEVTVVSAEDHEGLEKGLSEEFKQKAGEKITSEAGEELKVFPEAVSLEVKERHFDREIGEEAETASLSMEVRAQTLGFRQDSLKELLAAEMAERVPEEFDLIPGQIQSQEEFLREFDGKTVVKVNFQANLVPKLDLVKVKKKVAGKKPGFAQDYLNGLSRVTGTQVTLWPPLPSFLWRLPRRTERIEIEIKPE